MNATFWKFHDGMSLELDYDAAKDEDCTEAARLVEAFMSAARKAAEEDIIWPRIDPSDGIQTAIKATCGKTDYDRGFRNALRYARWLVDGTVPEYEPPTWGNEDDAHSTDSPERQELDRAIRDLTDICKDARNDWDAYFQNVNISRVIKWLEMLRERLD